MGEVVDEMFQGFLSTIDVPSLDDVQSSHGILECDDDDDDQGGSISSDDDSSISIGSCSSDFMEDATSSYASPLPSSPPPPSSLSPPSSSELDLNGPLFELSELMTHLPIKRGLSKHFQGKSQSFTSLANVRCLKDLAKREIPYRRRMTQCKSYGCGLDRQKSYSPKGCTRIISKKASRVSFSSFVVKRSSFVCSRAPIHVQKNF